MAAAIPALLAQLIDRDRATVEQSYWIGELEACNFCAADLAQCGYAVDGEIKATPPTALGRWGIMCPRCFAQYGAGVKWGSGQLYERQPSGEWLLVGGFPPESTDYD